MKADHLINNVSKNVHQALKEVLKDVVSEALQEETEAVLKELEVSVTGYGGSGYDEPAIYIGAFGHEVRKPFKEIVDEYLLDWGDDPDFIREMPMIADALEEAAKRLRDNATSKGKQRNAS